MKESTKHGLIIVGGVIFLVVVLGIISAAMMTPPEDSGTPAPVVNTTPVETAPAAPATPAPATPAPATTSEAESQCPVCGETATYMGMFSGFPGYICYNHADTIMFVCDDEYDFKMWSYYSDYIYDEHLSDDEIHMVTWNN